MSQSRIAAQTVSMIGISPVRAIPVRALIVAFSLIAGTAVPMAHAQPAADATAEAKAAASAEATKNASLLADFVHYVRIQNYDLAEAVGTELLGKGLSNADFVGLVEASGEVTRFEESVQRAMRVTQLEKTAAGLAKAFDSGKLERARNPEQIAENIKLLTTTDRGRRLAEERLVYAGEYAMPQLLEAFLDRSNTQRRAAVQRVIVSLGRQAVIPLTTAMLKVGAVQQEQIAQVLGSIPHRTSLPFLADLASTATVEAVKSAATTSFSRIAAGESNLSLADAATLYRSLADVYYAERSDVTSFPGEDNQILWGYEPGAGLVMTAIKTPVYHEAMAMRLSVRAMQIESASGGASPETLAMWVASNFSREIDTPEGYDNPAYPVSGPDARRSATYYAVAAGADVAQRVLSRAIGDRDTPLARQAISAVEKTAGGKDLWSGSNSSAPLLAALNYPNRRVQYEAALALAAAQPNAAFAGSDRVVPTLASTIRGATTQYAIVLTPEPEQYQAIRATLTKAGYTVLPQGRRMADLDAPISEAPAIDLVVAAGLTGESISGTIEDVRGQSKTLATPVLALTSATTYMDLTRRYASDAGVAVRQAAISEQQMSEAVKQLVDRASGGPIGEAEAAEYATRSLSALRDLAVSQNTVLNAGDAAAPLIAAITPATGVVKLKIAEILSRVDQDRAQRAVLDAAMTATGEERVALLDLVGESGKRFGNKLEAGQVTKLTELAVNGGDEEATAAASLIGTLNLGRTELVPMLLKQK